MDMQSKLYKAVSCNENMVTTVDDETVYEGPFGFVLIGDRLVPYSFIEMVADDIGESVFPYHAILSARDYVSNDLWDRLDEDERQVLGGVILLLIEHKRITVCIEYEDDGEHVCAACATKH